MPEDESRESTTPDDEKPATSVAEIKEAAAKPPDSEADIGPSAQR